MKIKAVKLPGGNWNCRVGYTDAEGKYQRKSFTAPIDGRILILKTIPYIFIMHELKTLMKNL